MTNLTLKELEFIYDALITLEVALKNSSVLGSALWPFDIYTKEEYKENTEKIKMKLLKDIPDLNNQHRRKPNEEI